jgi:hypothetical protein
MQAVFFENKQPAQETQRKTQRILSVAVLELEMQY